MRAKLFLFLWAGARRARAACGAAAAGGAASDSVGDAGKARAAGGAGAAGVPTRSETVTAPPLGTGKGWARYQTWHLWCHPSGTSTPSRRFGMRPKKPGRIRHPLRLFVCSLYSRSPPLSHEPLARAEGKRFNHRSQVEEGRGDFFLEAINTP